MLMNEFKFLSLLPLPPGPDVLRIAASCPLSGMQHWQEEHVSLCLLPPPWIMSSAPHGQRHSPPHFAQKASTRSQKMVVFLKREIHARSAAIVVGFLPFRLQLLNANCCLGFHKAAQRLSALVHKTRTIAILGCQNLSNNSQVFPPFLCKRVFLFFCLVLEALENFFRMVLSSLSCEMTKVVYGRRSYCFVLFLTILCFHPVFLSCERPWDFQLKGNI